jgi:hypothetical protein
MLETIPLHLHLGKVRLTVEAVGLVGREEAKRSQDLDELVTEATILVERLRPLWDRTKEDLEDLSLGIRDVLAAGAAAREMFTATLEMAAHVAERAEANTGGAVKGLPRLLQAIAEGRDWTRRVLDSWPRPDQLLPPPNAETLRQVRQAQAERQDGEDVRDILARVQAGGALVKE